LVLTILSNEILLVLLTEMEREGLQPGLGGREWAREKFA